MCMCVRAIPYILEETKAEHMEIQIYVPELHPADAGRTSRSKSS